MTLIQIDKSHTSPAFALFQLGFRPFFSAAGLFAVIAMLLWLQMYVYSKQLPLSAVFQMTWHAHEMIYGYAMAAVAGFLLTAVGNWTGIPTLRGRTLAALFTLWLVARVAWFIPWEYSALLAAAAEALFILGLIVGISLPVIRVRQWKQLGIISKLWLILAADGLFYAGVLGYLEQGVRWGLYSGLYLILALIFVMARRVLPFFIERGVDEACSSNNRLWIDIASLVLFLIWAALDIFTQQGTVIALMSVGLFAVHAWRLYDWHTAGIWKKPLLWSLYLGYASLTLGFLLKALSIWQGLSPGLVVHTFAVGGIGLMTIGMMSRVALGHTGRDVFNPPRILEPIFILIIFAAISRVALPLVDPAHYTIWIATSQVFWILGFALFSAVYIPQLVRPRIDGRPG
jgi:uncharacterized protein involved in response to NO